MNLFNTLSSFVVLLYLIISSLHDIKTHTISVKLSVCTIIICTIMKLFAFDYDIYTLFMWLICGCIVGSFLLILSFLSKECLGYGDGIALIVTGIGSGLKISFLTCGFAFITASVYACFLLIMKRNKNASFPFLPFICAAYLLQLLILWTS